MLGHAAARTPPPEPEWTPFFQDVRYAARTLRKSPTFTIIAVVCLAVGIATNTTLFSCFNAIVLRPFPFADPDRLVALWDFNPKNGNRDGLSYPTYIDWRDQSRSFSGIGAYTGRSVAITEGSEPARLDGQLVSGNLFPLLASAAAWGDCFAPTKTSPARRAWCCSAMLPGGVSTTRIRPSWVA